MNNVATHVPLPAVLLCITCTDTDVRTWRGMCLDPWTVQRESAPFQRKALICSQVFFFPKEAILGIYLRPPDKSVWGWRCRDRENLEVGYSFSSSPLPLHPPGELEGEFSVSSVRLTSTWLMNPVWWGQCLAQNKRSVNCYWINSYTPSPG